MPPFSFPGQFRVSCTPFPNDILCVKARLDGVRVMRTRLDSEAISLEEAEEAYKGLALVEQARKEVKHDLAVRLVFHQVEERIEAQIFVSFIACCLPMSLKNIAGPRAGGLTPRAIIEAFGTIQMVDVNLPTTDGRHLVLPSCRAAPSQGGSTSFCRASSA